jgi:hypothetical protein
LPSPAGTGSIKQQLQVAPRQAREPGRWMHIDFKAKHIGIEGDDCVHILNDVPNTDLAHNLSPPELFFDPRRHKISSRFIVDSLIWTLKVVVVAALGTKKKYIA